MKKVIDNVNELILRGYHFLRTDKRGQGMVEYGLILALIAVVLIAAFTNVGTAAKAKLNDVINGLGGTPVQ